ncbi:MAG: hypothetical protein ACR2IE_15660 [Candidatus Sumerlaeaceae bacterium]
MIEYILLAHTMHQNTMASADAASAKATATSAAGAAERLEMRLGALELTVETLLRMLIDSGRFTEQEFLKLLATVDAEDGRVDGRRDMFRLRRQCPKCDRFSGGDRTRCMWCGENMQGVKPAQVE